MVKMGIYLKQEIDDALAMLLEKSIHNKVPLLGIQARQEILENWSAKKEAERLIDVYLT